MKKDHARRVLAYQEFKRRLPPLTAILEHYGHLAHMKRVGSQLFSSCPIHGGSGSNPKQFVVNPATSEWKCFSPAHDAGGSTIEFVMAMQNCDFQEATAHIARWFAMPSGTSQSQRKRRREVMSGEKPSHKVYVVEGEGDSAFWHRAGSCWPHKDGKGLNMQIPVGMSLSGRVVLREYTADDEEHDTKAKRKK